MSAYKGAGQHLTTRPTSTVVTEDLSAKIVDRAVARDVFDNEAVLF